VRKNLATTQYTQQPNNQIRPTKPIHQQVNYMIIRTKIATTQQDN